MLTPSEAALKRKAEADKLSLDGSPAEILALLATIERLRGALAKVTGLLSTGNPPFSAREANARRIARAALDPTPPGMFAASEAALKRKAEAAPEKHWRVNPDNDTEVSFGDEEDCDGADLYFSDPAVAYAAFIAAADPAEILTLLAKLTECRAEVERLQSLIADIQPGMIPPSPKPLHRR